MIINSKKFLIVSSIIVMLVGILISLLAYFSYDTFIHIICILLGIVIILFNIYPVMKYSSLMTQDKRYIPHFIIALAFLIIGVLFIFSHGFVISIITAVFLLILPIIRIIMAVDKKNQFLREIPLLVIGIMVFFNVFDGIFRYVLIASGGIIFILGLIFFISIFVNKKDKNKDNGVIDAEITEL